MILIWPMSREIFRIRNRKLATCCFQENEGKRKDLHIKMNKNLYSFMKENGIYISGPNREEMAKQLKYLLSCYMTFGIKTQKNG